MPPRVRQAPTCRCGAPRGGPPIWPCAQGGGRGGGGRADYVAVRAGRVTVQRAASQLLHSVRRDGPPSRLPKDEDFSGDRAGLGQTYDAAWAVVRLAGG